MFIFDTGQRFGAGARRDDPIAGVLQIHTIQLNNVRLVIDNQNRSRHGGILSKWIFT